METDSTNKTNKDFDDFIEEMEEINLGDSDATLFGKVAIFILLFIFSIFIIRGF